MSYPNPSTGILNIDYQLPEAADVQISLVDLQGKAAYSRQMGFQSAGTQHVQVDASALSSGLYFLWLQIGSECVSRRLSLVD